MKLIALITQSNSHNEAQIILNFYSRSIRRSGFNTFNKDGEIQIKKTFSINYFKDFFDCISPPSSDSFFLNTPYASEINRIVEPLLADALSRMTSQQRYEFSEEMFSNVNKEMESFLGNEATCYIERPWPREKINNPHLQLPLKLYRYFENDRFREFCCLNHNCILTKDKIRKFFCNEAFCNGYDADKIERFLYLAAPLSSEEVSKLIKYAPAPENLAAAADFITLIAKLKSLDFKNPNWIEMSEYINYHRNFCIKAITTMQKSDEYLKIIESLKKALVLIPPDNPDVVSKLLESAPLPSNLVMAGNFIKIITESEVFDPEISIWVEIIRYINKYKNTCIQSLATTNDRDEYSAILEAALNDVIWADGLPQFREILITRLELKNGGELESLIQSFLLEQACTLFPKPSSVKIAERLRHYLGSCAGAYNAMSDANQLRLFNLCSALACQIALLNENDSTIKAAVEYANSRMVDTMNSVQWNADKGLKKAALMVARKENRAVAALVNRIVTDLNSYFSKSVVAELYAAILLPHKPHPDWIALCETVPSISSSLVIREGLARYFLSIGNVTKAKPHVMAILNFEPNSKLAAELKLLLSRETAIKAMAEDGFDIENIDKMTGVEFEKVLIKKLRGLGLKVMETPGSGDYGADIVIDDEDETRFIIQCKRFSSKVNLKAVQEIVAAMKHYSADYAIVATNSEFLKSAVELAKSNDVELWAGAQVMQVLSGDISSTVLATATLPEPVDDKPLATKNFSNNHI